MVAREFAVRWSHVQVLGRHNDSSIIGLFAFVGFWSKLRSTILKDCVLCTVPRCGSTHVPHPPSPLISESAPSTFATRPLLAIELTPLCQRGTERYRLLATSQS